MVAYYQERLGHKARDQVAPAEPASCKGFGLLEVIICLLIASVTASGALSGLRTLQAAFRFRCLVQKIESTLHFQSIRATLLDRSIDLKAATSGIQLCQDAECNHLLLELSSEFSIINPRFRQKSSNLDHITYYADGSASPGRLTVHDSLGRSADIVQALRGRRQIIFKGIPK